MTCHRSSLKKIFQSTLPAGEATNEDLCFMVMARKFQSTLPAGEATILLPCVSRPEIISIHASRGGSDCLCRSLSFIPMVFQSTLPAGEATSSPMSMVELEAISIHASRGGSDNFRCRKGRPQSISIHASRGGSDTVQKRAGKDAKNFNPRFPRGKRPSGPCFSREVYHISIHASRGGSDIMFLSSHCTP